MSRFAGMTLENATATPSPKAEAAKPPQVQVAALVSDIATRQLYDNAAYAKAGGKAVCDGYKGIDNLSKAADPVGKAYGRTPIFCP